MSTTLDDLDRLAFLLARTVRAHHPAWLTQGFTLGDLESRLLPFREARRELADGSQDAFERLLLRLLGGERGYLLTDAALRDGARAALEQPFPSLSLVRPMATTRVVLARPSAGLGGDRNRVAAAMAGVHASAGTPMTPRDGTPREQEALGATPAAGAAATAAAVHAEPAAPGVPCLHCGCTLPGHRPLSFCPHCGSDLRRRHCPACSTEMELAWRFCVTCGRGADAPATGEEGTTATPTPVTAGRAG